MKELYKGGLESISFQTAADQARELINSWVESQTNGKGKQNVSIGIFPSANIFEQHRRALKSREINTKPLLLFLLMDNRSILR